MNYSDITCVTINTADLNRKPTANDNRNTLKLFKDFWIMIEEIPPFNTIAELLQWRKQRIRQGY